MNCCHSPSFGLHRSNRPPRSAAFKPFAQVNSSLEQPFLNSRLLDKRDKQKTRTNITHEPLARSSAEEVCRRRGSCRSSRRGRAVLSSTTACTAPRTRWRSSRARCRSGPSFLASFEARVCVSASACLLCVSALRGCSAWLSGKRDQTTFGPASAANSWPSARRSRGACAVWAMSHTRASRNLDFGFEVRGERQARVPVAAPAILSFSMCVY